MDGHEAGRGHRVGIKRDSGIDPTGSSFHVCLLKTARPPLLNLNLSVPHLCDGLSKGIYPIK